MELAYGRVIFESYGSYAADPASIAVMRNRGAEPSAVVVGDNVTISGAPSARGRNEILARSVLLSSGYEFTFGSPNAYFPAGKAGRVIGVAKIDGNVAAATAVAAYVTMKRPAVVPG